VSAVPGFVSLAATVEAVDDVALDIARQIRQQDTLAYAALNQALGRARVFIAIALFGMASCSKNPAAPSVPVVVREPGTAGSADAVGCADGLWKHVHNPERFLIKNDCATVTGVIVDSTAGRPTHEADGVRHEPDGDTHGWLRLDPQFANLLSAGNFSDQEGNLVFEIVCHYVPPPQADSIAACLNFSDAQPIPRVGTHVAIKGTFVEDTNHARWNEIHPVSSITVR
jgi:hypothetical protein